MRNESGFHDNCPTLEVSKIEIKHAVMRDNLCENVSLVPVEFSFFVQCRTHCLGHDS